MARWLTEICGDAFDTEEARYWFSSGDVFAFVEGATTFLSGQAFEACAEAADVAELANRTLDEIYAVIGLLQPGVQRPTVGKICRELDDGTRTGNVIMAGVGQFRMKLRVMHGDVMPPLPPTQAQEFLVAARGDRHLQVAIFLLAVPNSSWPHLYRSLEELEHHLLGTVHSHGLCSANQRERFTRSANAAEVAGVDARHRIGKFEPPSNPMSFTEARGFVVGLLHNALRRSVESMRSSGDAG